MKKTKKASPVKRSKSRKSDQKSVTSIKSRKNSKLSVNKKKSTISKTKQKSPRKMTSHSRSASARPHYTQAIHNKSTTAKPKTKRTNFDLQSQLN